MPGWLLKAVTVLATLGSAAGFSSYVLAHVKPPRAPLHPVVVRQTVAEEQPVEAGAPADSAQPAPVIVVRVVTVQAPAPGSQGPGPASLSGWLSQTNVPQATTTYAS